MPRTSARACVLGLVLSACRVVGSPSPPPATAPPPANHGRVTALALSTKRTCAVHETGRVTCRGGGQPERVLPGLPHAAGVVVLREEACIWTQRGTVHCVRPDGETAARSLHVFGEVVQLASFNDELFALTRDGGVWDLNSDLRESRFSPLPRWEDAAEIVAGGYFHCVRRRRGTVSCAIQYLYDGPRVEDLPVDDARQISAGPDGVCALRTNGAVRCWTLDVDFEPPFREDSLPELPPFTAIAVGYRFACGIGSTGATTCWGDDIRGKLGEPDIEGKQPRQVRGIADAEALFVGDEQACVRRRAGGIWCWGNDEHGVIADGDQASTSVPPAPWRIPGLRGLSADNDRTCAWRSDGTVLCWGTSRAWVRPMPVSAAGQAQALVSDRSFDCALTPKGEVACRTVHRPTNYEVPDPSRGWWTVAGIHDAYALSVVLDLGMTLHTDGVLRFFRIEPAPEIEQSREVFPGATSVERSLLKYYVHTRDARVYCVDGATRCPSAEPSRDVASIAVKLFDVACELRTDGSLRCTGVRFPDSPVDVPGTFAAPLAASDSRVCALTSDRRAVWCMEEPTTALPEPALDITISNRHTCATFPNERLTCWGDNTWGQLGNGYAGVRAVPTLTYPE